MDFRGFDSSIILNLSGEILMSLGNFPEDLSQAILVGIMLGRLGVPAGGADDGGGPRTLRAALPRGRAAAPGPSAFKKWSRIETEISRFNPRHFYTILPREPEGSAPGWLENRSARRLGIEQLASRRCDGGRSRRTPWRRIRKFTAPERPAVVPPVLVSCRDASLETWAQTLEL